MKISIVELQDLYPVNKQRVREVIGETLSQERKDAELSIALVNEEEMRRLNKQFLGIDDVTDVLSFPLDSGRGKVGGEIVVCVPVAIKTAKELGVAVEGEVLLYIVHGLLHLLGYRDKKEKDARLMHKREKEILSGFGYQIKGL